MKKSALNKCHRIFYCLLFVCTALLATASLAPPSAIAHGAETHLGQTPPDLAAPNILEAGSAMGALTAQPGEKSDTPPTNKGRNPDHSEGRAHDHSSHAANDVLLETGFGRLLIWMGTFHPAAVHFPIALLLAAAFAELLSVRRNTLFLQEAGRFCLWLGTIGALGAALLGWFYGGLHLLDDTLTLTLHRWNGTGIAVVALVALWLLERNTHQPLLRRGGYRTALLVVAMMVGANGYLGGAMVYGPEQHQWPEAPSEHSH